MIPSVTTAVNSPFVRDLGIYIHIPFCRKKCAYCDFLSFPSDEETIQTYIHALCGQIASFGLAAAYHPVSVFIGGGTPSLLHGGQLTAILDAVFRRFEITDPGELEITVECNPGTLDTDKLKAMKKAGVNRLSIGLQAAQDFLLRRLGRIHSMEEFLRSYTLACDAGFSNINLDLMSALPGQRLSDWEQTLHQAASLSPRHISAYSLIIEENTPFAALYGADGPLKAQLPDEETDREMYHMTKEILAAYGYRRYEISNYALPGFSCLHNEGYWIRREYVGFGLGAASLLENVRTKETADLDTYLLTYADPVTNPPAAPQQIHDIRTFTASQAEIEYLTEKDCMEETMFLGLRRMEGVNISDFEKTFGCSVWDIYDRQLRELTNNGLIRTEQNHIQLTDRGTDISNYVFAQFLLD